MLAFVNTPKNEAPIELREVAEPQATDYEAVVEVHAFSLMRGELALLCHAPGRPGYQARTSRAS